MRKKEIRVISEIESLDKVARVYFELNGEERMSYLVVKLNEYFEGDKIGVILSILDKHFELPNYTMRVEANKIEFVLDIQSYFEVE